MKKLNTLLALAICLALSPPSALALEAGQAVPDISLPGATVAPKLSDLKGKVVYLDFWASWCGPCKQSFPWMNDMQQKYGAKGLQVVGVNLDAKRPDAERFLAENPALFALAYDAKGETARQVGIKGMPTSVLIDADGKVLAIHQGFREQDRAELEAKFVSALNRAKAP